MMKNLIIKNKRACPAKLQRSGGFTLIELMVSIGLFVLVVTMSLGSLIGVFDANSKSQSMASVMNNLNYALDSITRNVRFAGIYHCGNTGTIILPQNCADNTVGDTFIAITSGVQTTIYRFNNSRIEKSTDGGSTYTAVTGSEVVMTNVKFRVFNTLNTSTGSNDNRQPYIVLNVSGYSGSKPSTQTIFDMETVISQRELDI